MVDKYCWAYILHRDRLAVKSGNQENLLEGTSVACQIIGFGDQNSDTGAGCRTRFRFNFTPLSSPVENYLKLSMIFGLRSWKAWTWTKNTKQFKKTKSFSSSFCWQTDQLKPKLNHLYVLGVFSKSCPSISNKRVTATGCIWSVVLNTRLRVSREIAMSRQMLSHWTLVLRTSEMFGLFHL